ncbi:hypothetical protein GCM10010470_03410 [Saccharopolyspora taberi]|uniref:Resuscitation-promoting factor core lysozyme-like domain-containing protein n=1 Tax=Saccharopolyspora taberi TaxID=60895 RepID=A0ABN3V248_9PSEU
MRRNRFLARTVLIGALVAAAPLAAALPAGAASASTWDAVAQCESTGNWSADTGNGFSGGLQFTDSTWSAHGGTRYAAKASQASRQEQIAVAEKVLAAQGANAWPVCGKKAGLG